MIFKNRRRVHFNDVLHEFSDLTNLVGYREIDFYALGMLKSNGLLHDSVVDRDKHTKYKDTGFRLVIENRSLNFNGNSGCYESIVPFEFKRQGESSLAYCYLCHEILKSLVKQITIRIKDIIVDKPELDQQAIRNSSDLATLAMDFYSKNHEFNLVFNPRNWGLVKNLGTANACFDLQLIDKAANIGLRLLPDWNWPADYLLFAGNSSIVISGDSTATIQRLTEILYEFKYRTMISVVDYNAMRLVSV